MSSAILYVAIVAIWAGVLIPRWLRRDSSDCSASSGGSSGSGGSASSGGSGGSGGEWAGDELTAAGPEPAVAGEPAPRSRHRHDASPEGRPSVRPGEPVAGGPEPPSHGPRDQEHKKVLSARRRLLGMLLVLATGSGALAFTRLAAWWVVVPPTIMLLGYVALLREAAKADAERREAARTRVTASAATAGGADASRAAPPAAPAAPVAPAPAPNADVIDISASVTSGEEELYDQYADAKLRAVGDLVPALTGCACRLASRPVTTAVSLGSRLPRSNSSPLTEGVLLRLTGRIRAAGKIRCTWEAVAQLWDLRWRVDATATARTPRRAPQYRGLLISGLLASL